MPEAQYQAHPMIFASRGLVAKYATDRAPQGTYLNLKGVYERAEDALSTRYGSTIVNRDPNGTAGGVNYLLPGPILTLSRLKYNAATWRYAGSGTGLYRRVGDTQGQYTLVASGLSGTPFGTASTNCFASSQPYLFIADANLMLKDSGTGTPTQWGIAPPIQPATTTPYAPKVILIDDFTASLGSYALVNVTGWTSETITTLVGTTRASLNGFVEIGGSIPTIQAAFNGAIALDPSSVPNLIFNIYSTPNPPQFSVIRTDGGTPSFPNKTFTMTAYQGSIAANTTGSISQTVSLDLSQNYQVTDDDLICFALQLSDPSAISQINLKFDIQGSNYTSSYYTKSISPAYYQGGVSGDTDAYTTASNEILALSLGLLTGSNSASSQQQTDSIVNQLQSSTANTGIDAWSTIYSRRGDFLSVGNAGEAGYDWSSVTGWQIEIITTTSSSVNIGCNGLYLQWGAGPSSFGGVGYDYRYLYFDANTQTPSNPSTEQYFSQQFGYVASYTPPIVLRQAFNVGGIYSTAARVTHVRIYRRGGYLGDNWHYVDQIPNITAGGLFSYKDIIPDASLLQSDILQLDNDPPITSSLQNPLVTTLTSATTAPGTTPYDTFLPQTLTVAGGSFLMGQLVVVGTPQNLEQVRSLNNTSGYLLAVLRLNHAIGEQVQVFSIPQQPCDLVELAYNQLWVAGDPNNPHFLYYSKPGYPENFSPANYIPVGSPSSPIMAVINFRGTLYVATLTTWYQIVPGNPPYAQATGSKHGLVSKKGWTQTEGSIWYEAIDGIREFRGADGPYRTLPIEWIYQGINLTPLPLVDRTSLSTVCLGFRNNTVFAAYKALDGTVDRIVWDGNFSRWRNDDVPATAMFLEEDTNTLLYGKPYLVGGAIAGYVICQDQVNDYDDGGWSNGVLVQTPIAMDCKLPYQDLGAPHFPKQWNTVEVDANTNGQTVSVILNFDDGIASLNLGTMNTSTRQKVQFKVNSGMGQQSYKASAEMTSSVLVAPFVYQMDIYAEVLAANRTSLDSYFMKFGTDASKFAKQAYFDYTSTSTVALAFYTDGSSTPYYSFVLPAAPSRAVVRVRLPALKFRTWRVIALSGSSMQMWSAPRVEWKALTYGSDYAISEVAV